MSRRIIAQHVADGMVLSTANIYFTAHDNAGARVFRTAQSATPGHEAELCHEPACRFGDIVFANVDGVLYGYFFALTSGMTTIRRIPLPRNRARLPKSSGLRPRTSTSYQPWQSGHRRILTYWQSDTAINKMPIRGGAVTVLNRTPLTRPATGLHLVGPNLIYAVDRVVYHVPADGSAITPPALRVVFTAATGVVACVPAQGGFIIVAERNGAIVEHSNNADGVAQDPGAAFITSMVSNVVKVALCMDADGQPGDSPGAARREMAAARRRRRQRLQHPDRGEPSPCDVQRRRRPVLARR